MKKTIIISAIALCFSIVNVNANPSNKMLKTTTVTSVIKVSPFCVSIAKGDFETVKKLIDLGTDVNQKSDGMTPAMYAAKFNRTDILQLLIDEGANLKVKSDKGMTAKEYAEIHKATDAFTMIEGALKNK